MTSIQSSLIALVVAASALTGCTSPVKAPHAESERSSQQSGLAAAASGLNRPAPAPPEVKQRSVMPAPIVEPRCARDWGSPLLNAVADRRTDDIKALAAAVDARVRTRMLSEALPLTLEGESTLCRSAKSDPEMLRLLLRLGGNINYPSESDEKTFLMTAVAARDSQMTQLALNSGANPNSFSYHESPLILAVRVGDQEAVAMLLASGAAVNLRVGKPDARAYSALSAAARYPGPRSTVLKTLIAQGARYPAWTDAQPIEEFARFYHGRPEDADETLTLLLSLGGRINRGASANPSGMHSPLYWSVESSSTSMAVLQALLRHGADPNQYVLYSLGARRDYSNIPLKRRDILELLFQNGARVSKTPKRGTSDVRAFLLANQTKGEADAYIRELDEMTVKYSDLRKP